VAKRLKVGLFLTGHDKIAESVVLLIKYGGVPQLLARHGYAPGVSILVRPLKGGEAVLRLDAQK
jgi:hypothetical protein